jgi:TDG/mug DNA glycosylase family protein
VRGEGAGCGSSRWACGRAWLAVVGITAYRVAFDAPRAAVGPQEATIGDAHVWLLPNPSGLNAHWQLPELAAEFARLRAAAVA